MDGFDELPDSLTSEIFNRVGDVKTLLRCCCVSKRINLLASHALYLFLRLDHIDLPESDSESPLVNIFRSILSSLHQLLSFFPKPARGHGSPAQILSRFGRVRTLEIEIPGGDLRLEKFAFVKWRAEFGRTLKSCVILAFRSVSESATIPQSSSNGGDANPESEELALGLKTRVVWTVSALITASTRHFFLREVVKQHAEMEKLVLGDREAQGTLFMDREGLLEYRDAIMAGLSPHMNRTVMPSVRMSMRHEPKLRLESGVCLDGATLVVVRPSAAAKADVDDAELASAAFIGGDGIYEEAIRGLLKRRSSTMEISSF